MEGIGTSATAMLVDTPTDAGGRPDAVSVTLTREEVEEALASDEPLDLILSVDPGSGTPQDVRIGWDRTDLETGLSGAGAGGVTFSFDRAELYRALEHPDFEGHGMREMVLLTVAAASASAALAASTASGQLLDTAGGGGATAVAVEPGHGEAGTAAALATPAIPDEAGAAARGVGQTIPGNDEAGVTARGLDPAIATAIGAHDEATTGRDLATPAIPDEAGAAARGVGQTIPGADEATLTARGIGASPAVHDEGTLVTRGIETPATPVDSGSSFEMPALDSGAAAAIGGLAGAGLLIVGAAFVARRRTTPA
jgi:hypothetical protein